MTDRSGTTRELSFESVAAGLNMTRPVRPSTLRNAVDYLASTRIPEGNHPSISPDAGQNRQIIPGVSS